MIKNYVLAAAPLMALASPAFAQDAGVEIYGGGLAGIDQVQIGPIGNPGKENGAVYGAFIGAQTVRGGAVFGVEGEYTDATTDSEASNVFTSGDTLNINAGRDWSIGGRIGGYVTPNVMFYGKGAYTNARINVEYGGPAASIENSRNLSGYRLGAGMEVGRSNLRFRTEYRYSSYGERDLSRFGLVGAGRTNIQRHQVVAGALFAF